MPKTLDKLNAKPGTRQLLCKLQALLVLEGKPMTQPDVVEMVLKEAIASREAARK